jgi:triacylglycerol lipase
MSRPSVICQVLFATMWSLSAVGCAADSDLVDDVDEATGEVNPRLDPVRVDPATRSNRRAARYPIVLMHGFNASSNETLPGAIWGFYRVRDTLMADGHEVFALDVPPFASVDRRARLAAVQLRTILDDWERRHRGVTPKVNLIAHSMGGLDARHLISQLGFGGSIASLTTMSTPHRGSNAADFVLSILPGRPGGAVDARINQLASMWGAQYSEMADNSDLRTALYDISEAAAPQFNATHPDDTRVYYQSFAGVSNKPPFTVRNPQDLQVCQRFLGGPTSTDLLHPLIALGADFVAHGYHLYPNDGMVRVSSARGPVESSSSRWVFRGCLPADHLDEVGQPRHEGTDQRTGFNHLRFYRNVAYELADRGF